MPRTYNRSPGARRYLDVEDNVLEEVIVLIKSNKETIKGAAKKLGISKNTIRKHLRASGPVKPGCPTVLSSKEESILANAIATTADWGFPLDITDIKVITKTFLDSAGRNEKRFQANYPGNEWVHSFLKRNRVVLTCRLANNLTRSKAEVTQEMLSKYFTNLETTGKDIPASNIFNYDESNLSDDPGRKKLIFRRGVKYPDRVINHTKSSTTIMMCGSGSGVLLPVYVVYKSENLYDTWTQGGPKGAPCCVERCCMGGTFYNRTKHGWFDSVVFTDWFKKVLLPHAKNLTGTKLMIGDNLSSHFTTEVLQLCEENDIKFVCIPPNTTHLAQPLDVGFFHPLKSRWRKILTHFKISNPRYSTVPKVMFPSLLNELLISLQDNIKSNLQNGFKSCGIFPLNKAVVLAKLPCVQDEAGTKEAVAESLVTYLKSLREKKKPVVLSNTKKKKINISPGKAVLATHVSPLETANNDNKPVKRPSKQRVSDMAKKLKLSSGVTDSNEPQPSTSTGTITQTLKQVKTKTNLSTKYAESSSDDDDEPGVRKIPDLTDESDFEPEDPSLEDVLLIKCECEELVPNDFIVVKVIGGKRGKQSFHYVSIVQSVDKQEKCVELLGLTSVDKAKLLFVPKEKDVFSASFTDVLGKLPSPVLVQEGRKIVYKFPGRVLVKEI